MMTQHANKIGIGVLVLAAMVAGCHTTPPTARGKLCIDVVGQDSGDGVATVHLDGEQECEVSMLAGKDFFLFCPAGKHRFKIEAEGHAAYEGDVNIRPGKTSWISVELKRPAPEPAANTAADAQPKAEVSPRELNPF
ncbi:MAG: PEGA domain-containing protein [Lentisphaerae bacterium]|nr:PEGA domain-containing protein [Lentisphaerota bacterium]